MLIGASTRVLNFCFSGFAGQSMLLLVPVKDYFLGFSILPQADACGSWENTICAIVVNAMEEPTGCSQQAGRSLFIDMVPLLIRWCKTG